MRNEMSFGRSKDEWYAAYMRAARDHHGIQLHHAAHIQCKPLLLIGGKGVNPVLVPVVKVGQHIDGQFQFLVKRHRERDAPASQVTCFDVRR